MRDRYFCIHFFRDLQLLTLEEAEVFERKDKEQKALRVLQEKVRVKIYAQTLLTLLDYMSNFHSLWQPLLMKSCQSAVDILILSTVDYVLYKRNKLHFPFLFVSMWSYVNVSYSIQMENKREEYNNLCKEQDEEAEKISIAVSLCPNM